MPEHPPLLPPADRLRGIAIRALEKALAFMVEGREAATGSEERDGLIVTVTIAIDRSATSARWGELP